MNILQFLWKMITCELHKQVCPPFLVVQVASTEATTMNMKKANLIMIKQHQ